MHPAMAKRMTGIAQNCFVEMIGDQRTRQFYKPEDVVYGLNVLTEMVKGYIESTASEKAAPEVNVLIIGKNGKQCPQCENEEVSAEHTFCKICGLKL